MKTLLSIVLAAGGVAFGLTPFAPAQAADTASAPAATSTQKPATTHPRHSHAVEKGLIPPRGDRPARKHKPMRPKEERHVHGAERH